MEKIILSNNEVNVGNREKLDFGFNGEKDYLHDVADSCMTCDHSEVYEGYGLWDDRGFNAVSPPLQECLKELARLNGMEDVVEHQKKAKEYSYSPVLLRLLNDYGSGLKRLSGAKRIKPSDGYISIKATETNTWTSGRLSAEETMRLAGEKLIQSYSDTLGGFSVSTNPHDLSSLGLSEQDIKNVQLAELLLAAAEKISQQRYGFASRLLDQCDSYSNHAGNPVERVIYYFSESLRERIDRETGRTSDNGIGRKGSFNIEEAVMTNISTMASYGGTPFPRIAQFAGIQTIIENVTEAKKIHIIDLAIRFGSQWTLLIEALAERRDFQLELLKITAVGTISKDALEETGKRLMGFAESKKVPFRFKLVMVSDILDLHEELLNVDLGETVAVYSPYVLKTMLAIPDRLEHLMKIITRISPVVTVIIESDANLNSSAFVSRFIEALFFFSTYFDCLGECLGHDEKGRRIMEGVFYAEGIRNIVVMEGEERKIRNVRMEVWRAFIRRYGLEETEFSMSSLYQANLLLKECPSSSRYCTLRKNGKCLVMCWKGVPMHFVSVWKFT